MCSSIGDESFFSSSPNDGINKAFPGILFSRSSQKEKKVKPQSSNKLGDFWNSKYVEGREKDKYL